jgi:hypothetical protein
VNLGDDERARAAEQLVAAPQDLVLAALHIDFDKLR